MQKEDEYIVTSINLEYPKNTHKKIWISNYGNLYGYCEVNGFEICDNYYVFVNDKPFSETIIKKIKAYFEITTTIHAISHISNIHHIIQTLILEEKVERLTKIVEGQSEQIKKIIENKN